MDNKEHKLNRETNDMKSITKTTAYEGLSKAVHVTLDANRRNLDNRTYTPTGHDTIIRLAYKLMDIRRNYVDNQEANK